MNKQTGRVASSSRHCEFYKAQDGRWYMELASREYGDERDATTYGPFPTQDAAERYLSDNFSNPGGWYEDDSGDKPVPKRSPNGQPVERPQRRSMWGMEKRLVASEVQDIMIQQVRHFLREQGRALGKAFGGTWMPGQPLFKKEGQDAIVVTLQDFDDRMAGFRLKYDYGSDTYDFSPFLWPARGRVNWGETSSDFYVEDLGDVSKLVYIFERVK